MTKKKKPCLKCGTFISHHPTCKNLNEKQARELLLTYYEEWNDREDRWRKRESNLQLKMNRIRDDAAMWKGKYMTVKSENNKLRRKLNNQ